MACNRMAKAATSKLSRQCAASQLPPHCRAATQSATTCLRDLQALFPSIAASLRSITVG
jgi:hypothetical protein